MKDGNFNRVFPSRMADSEYSQIEYSQIDTDIVQLVKQFADMYSNEEYVLNESDSTDDTYIYDAQIGDCVMSVVVDFSDREVYAVNGYFEKDNAEYELPYCEYFRNRSKKNEEDYLAWLVADYMEYASEHPNKIDAVYFN